jgi:succinyl-CoA:acetate CoA-transferase
MTIDSTEESITRRIVGDVPQQLSADVARHIEADATVGVSGFGSVGYPKAVPLALTESGRDLSLTIISGGSVGEEIDTALVEADAIERRYPFQARPTIREKINEGSVAFHDRHISTLGDEVAYGSLVDLDVAIIEAIAVGENWLIPSTSIGHTPAYVAAADRLIVEINEAQPLGLQSLHDVYRQAPPPRRDPVPLSRPDERIGSPKVRFDPAKLLGVVRSERPDTPYSFRDPGEVERAISANLADFLADELERNPILAGAVHCQFGVGSIGNAMIETIEAIDFGDRTVHYLGEVFQDGLLDLLDDGRIESASATSLALSEEGQDRLFENLDQYAGDIVVRPASISNSPEVIDRFGVVGVNSALSIDIYGNVNSTHVGGTHVLNGIGGSADFNRNCPLAIVALPSMTSGDTSKIVPMVAHADHTEHDIDVVVTEHGLVDLRGRSPRERARMLINECAHPEVRADLRAYCDRAEDTAGNVPHDLETAFDWRTRGVDDE